MIESFRNSGISLETATRMGFPALVRHLKSPEFIGTTGKLLYRMRKYAARTSDSGTVSVSGGFVAVKAMETARVFLSAYMLTAYPREILTQIGEQEQVRFGIRDDVIGSDWRITWV